MHEDDRGALELWQKLQQRTNEKSIDSMIDKADAEIKRWKVIKPGPSGSIYLMWDEEDFKNSKAMEDRVKRTCFSISKVLYGGFEVYREKHSIGYRSGRHNTDIVMAPAIDETTCMRR